MSRFFDDWAWNKPGLPVGEMSRHDAERTAFDGGYRLAQEQAQRAVAIAFWQASARSACSATRTRSASSRRSSAKRTRRFASGIGSDPDFIRWLEIRSDSFSSLSTFGYPDVDVAISVHASRSNAATRTFASLLACVLSTQRDG